MEYGGGLILKINGIVGAMLLNLAYLAKIVLVVQVIVVKILLVLKLQFVMQKSILSFLLELYLYCVQISIMLELKLELLEKKIRGINVRKIINIPNAPKQLMKILLDAGYEAYVVGGCVRDFLDRKSVV